jgi:hypothetical protein
MSNTKSFAERELSLLCQAAKDPNNRPLVEEFIPEILALCDKFGKSGQSGGSAPYTAGAIVAVLKKLLMFEPIGPITGVEEEWNDVSEYGASDDLPLKQNKRCSALFQEGDEVGHYVDAIVWQGEEEWDTFTGCVYSDLICSEKISSSQNVKQYPFEPETFYIDVYRVPITKDVAETMGDSFHYIEGYNNECYYTVVKDPSQLEDVWEHYDKRVVKDRPKPETMGGHEISSAMPQPEYDDRDCELIPIEEYIEPNILPGYGE